MNNKNYNNNMTIYALSSGSGVSGIAVIRLSGDDVIKAIKMLTNGKIYDPGRGRIFKSNLYILDNGNLKVEGCFLRICGHEEWIRLK